MKTMTLKLDLRMKSSCFGHGLAGVWSIKTEDDLFTLYRSLSSCTMHSMKLRKAAEYLPCLFSKVTASNLRQSRSWVEDY